MNALPGSRCEQVCAENFVRNALNVLKERKEYADCVKSLVLGAVCAE